MIEKQFLKEQALRFDIDLTPRQLEQFDRYAHFLVEYNQKVNLTAITDSKEIVVKHFVDSLLLSKAYDFCNKQTTVADVGTGAGFPGMVIKIRYPQIKLTLLDSLQKRIVFLEQLAEKLEVENVVCRHIRAEEAGRSGEFREQFDLVTARAVADLAVLSEYCLPLVKVGGSFVALKGRGGKGEVKDAERALVLLGGSLDRILSFSLAEKEDRSLVCMKKISQTATEYPRKPKKIKQKTL